MRAIFRRSLASSAGLVAAALAPLLSAEAQQPDVTGAQTIRVLQRVDKLTFIDLGEPGEATGDFLVVDRNLVNPITEARLGRTRGTCFNVSGSLVTADFVLECNLTHTLPGGTLVTAGLFTSADVPVPQAITGGTGRFRNARGQMTGEFQPSGELLLSFHVLP